MIPQDRAHVQDLSVVSVHLEEYSEEAVAVVSFSFSFSPSKICSVDPECATFD